VLDESELCPNSDRTGILDIAMFQHLNRFHNVRKTPYTNAYFRFEC